MFGIICFVFHIWMIGVVSSSYYGGHLTLTPCQSRCTVISDLVFNITCQTSESDSISVTWYLVNGDIAGFLNVLNKTKDTVHVGVNSTLSFVPERKYHRWNLYCIAENKDFTIYSHGTLLNVLYGPDRPSFKLGGQYINSTTVSIIEGSNLSVECSGHSNPSATVKWYNGPSQHNGTWLNLSNINSNSAERLKCVLENQMKSSDSNQRYGKNKRYLNLEILTPPTVPIISYSGYHIVNNITLIEARDYDVNCSSVGKPSPQIHWKLLNSSIKQEVLYLGNVSALHNTIITCCATNHMIPTVGGAEHGLECTHLNVNVLHKPMFVFNATYVVKENDSFNITCTQQNINTAVTWMRQGDDNWSVTHNTIHWLKVTRENDGNYTCKLRYSITDSFEHSISGDSEYSFHLNVDYADVSVEVTSTTYTTSKQDSFVAAGLVGGLLVCCATVVFALKLRTTYRAGRTNNRDIHTPGAGENEMYISTVYRDARNVSGTNALTALPDTSDRELQSTISPYNLYSAILEEPDNAYDNVYDEFEA